MDAETLAPTAIKRLGPGNSEPSFSLRRNVQDAPVLWGLSSAWARKRRQKPPAGLLLPLPGPHDWGRTSTWQEGWRGTGQTSNTHWSRAAAGFALCCVHGSPPEPRCIWSSPPQTSGRGRSAVGARSNAVSPQEARGGRGRSTTLTEPQPRRSLIYSSTGPGTRRPGTTRGGNANRCSHWKTVWRFLKKLKTELPYDPTIPLLGIYQKKPQNINLPRYMHPNVHSSIIYNCQAT